MEEVKKDALRRAGRRNPFEGVGRADVETVLKNLKSLDREEWAEEWSKLGAAYDIKGDQYAREGKEKDAAKAYYQSYIFYRIGRYPVPSTAGKMAAYHHSVTSFLKAAKYFDSPLEVIQIPFEGKTFVGYLQVPRGARRPPVVIHWGGVDGWKEDRQANSEALHKAGLATFVMDMPGTGENPLPASAPRAERTFSAAIDRLQKLSQIDGNRIGVWGASFGGYWAAKLAFVEPKRIKAAVDQGGGVHYGFQEKWLVPALTKTASQYLLGPSSLLDARTYIVGVKTLDELLKIAPKMSLKEQGLLDKPSAPLLAVNGKKDDQQTIEDVYILLEHGNPKEARVYPDGGHMGRTPGERTDEVQALIIGWLTEKLAVSRSD